MDIGENGGITNLSIFVDLNIVVPSECVNGVNISIFGKASNLLDVKIFGNINISCMNSLNVHVGVAREGSITGVLVKTVLRINGMTT